MSDLTQQAALKSIQRDTLVHISGKSLLNNTDLTGRKARVECFFKSHVLVVLQDSDATEPHVHTVKLNQLTAMGSDDA